MTGTRAFARQAGRRGVPAPGGRAGAWPAALLACHTRRPVPEKADLVPTPGPPRSVPAAQPFSHAPRSGVHVVDWACELVGTALLVLGGLSAVFMDFGRGSPTVSLVHSHSLRLLLTGALFAACGSLVAVSPLGRRSGAHLNPAVTLAFWLRGHVHPHDLGGYIASQCCGAIAGAYAVKWLWGTRAEPVHYGVTLPGHGVGGWGAAGIEALMTGLLIATIFAFVSSSRTAPWAPLAVWVVVALLVWRGAGYTGTSLNPARSLGPALATGNWSYFWAYLVGPLGGAALVATLWAAAPRATLTAKLFHDARYKSMLGSHLPVKPGGAR